MTIPDFVLPKATVASRYLPALLLTLAVAIAMAVVGAFGSYVAMGLPIRLLHFSTTSLAICALAFALSETLRRCVFAGILPFWATMAVALAAAPLGALIIQQSLGLLAPHALRYVTFRELTAQVLFINVCIGLVTWAMLRGHTKAAEATREDSQASRVDDALQEFRSKLPLALRQATIVALSAEDHYVRVRTNRGQALILMNLANAIAALGADAGVRIHRSHWVSRSLAAEASNGGRRGIRVDQDIVLPVSRAGRKLLTAASQ